MALMWRRTEQEIRQLLEHTSLAPYQLLILMALIVTLQCQSSLFAFFQVTYIFVNIYMYIKKEKYGQHYIRWAGGETMK